MAKPQTQVVPQDEKEQVPAFLQEEMEKDAGKGVSTDAADNIVPLIYILDAKSPQCDQNDPRYVPGARAGSIWLRSFSKPIIDGNEGFLFQPCYFSKDWVEWVPRNRGGGFVKRHEWNEKSKDGEPDGAVQKPSQEDPQKMVWVMPQTGNEVKETRYHAGYAMIDGQAVPYVIPMSGTGHTVSRSWMFSMMSKRINDKIVPSFAMVYRLKTRQRTNAKGKWYVFEPAEERYTTAEEYARGRQLHDAFVSGEKQMEQDQQEHAAMQDAEVM